MGASTMPLVFVGLGCFKLFLSLLPNSFGVTAQVCSFTSPRSLLSDLGAEGCVHPRWYGGSDVKAMLTMVCSYCGSANWATGCVSQARRTLMCAIDVRDCVRRRWLATLRYAQPSTGS